LLKIKWTKYNVKDLLKKTNYLEHGFDILSVFISVNISVNFPIVVFSDRIIGFDKRDAHVFGRWHFFGLVRWFGNGILYNGTIQ